MITETTPAIEIFASLSARQLTELRAKIDELIAQKQAEAANIRTAHDIKLIVVADSICVESPYNSCFVGKAHGLQGKWNPLTKQWIFPGDSNMMDHVRNAMLACYGVTGETPYPVCTLLVKGFNRSEMGGGVELFGRPIAKAWGRDSGARLQENVILLSGKAYSGGSVKNWKTVVENATFEIRNFPVACLEWESVEEYIDKGKAEVK